MKRERKLFFAFIDVKINFKNFYHIKYIKNIKRKVKFFLKSKVFVGKKSNIIIPFKKKEIFLNESKI